MRTNFSMENEYITMVRGDTLSFGMEVDGMDGQDLELAYFTCKRDYTDTAVVFQKSLGNGITRVGEGQYAIRVAPADTADVAAGRYYYDLQIGANGDIFTVLIGVLEIDEDVTRGGQA